MDSGGPSVDVAGDRVTPALEAHRRRISAVRARVAPLIPALRVAGFVGAVAIVAYVGVRAATEVHFSRLTWWPSPFVLAGAAIWWLLLARGWALLAAGRTNRRDIAFWLRTQALRFLPGGIWAPASRVALFQADPLRRISTVAAENLLALVAAAALGGAALAASGRLLWVGLVAAIAVPPVAARFLPARASLTPAGISRAGVNYLLAFTAYAVAAVLTQIAVSGSVDGLAIGGAALVAWAGGLVVVVAPSGIGVRELIYIKLLSGSLPFAELAAAAVAMRLAMIAAELAILLVVGLPAKPASVATRR